MPPLRINLVINSHIHSKALLIVSLSLFRSYPAVYPTRDRIAFLYYTTHLNKIENVGARNTTLVSRDRITGKNYIEDSHYVQSIAIRSSTNRE